MAGEFFGEGDDLDRFRGLVQVHHPLENAAVGIEVEMLRQQSLGGFVDQVIIEDDAAENGTFGVRTGW